MNYLKIAENISIIIGIVYLFVYFSCLPNITLNDYNYLKISLIFVTVSLLLEFYNDYKQKKGVRK